MEKPSVKAAAERLRRSLRGGLKTYDTPTRQFRCCHPQQSASEHIRSLEELYVTDIETLANAYLAEHQPKGIPILGTVEHDGSVRFVWTSVEGV